MTENFVPIVEWLMSQVMQHALLCLLALYVWVAMLFYREMKASGKGVIGYIYFWVSYIVVYQYQLLTTYLSSFTSTNGNGGKLNRRAEDLER